MIYRNLSTDELHGSCGCFECVLDRVEEDYNSMKEKNVKLQSALSVAEEIIIKTISVIGDGDNGPPFFYTDIFEELENSLEQIQKLKEKF